MAYLTDNKQAANQSQSQNTSGNKTLQRKGETLMPPNAQNVLQLKAMIANSLQPQAIQLKALREQMLHSPEGQRVQQMKAMIASSPQMQRAAQLQTMANNYAAQRQAPVQRMSKEEEMLQGKFEIESVEYKGVAQLQDNENDRLKMESVYEKYKDPKNPLSKKNVLYNTLGEGKDIGYFDKKIKTPRTDFKSQDHRLLKKELIIEKIKERKEQKIKESLIQKNNVEDIDKQVKEIQSSERFNEAVEGEYKKKKREIGREISIKEISDKAIKSRNYFHYHFNKSNKNKFQKRIILNIKNQKTSYKIAKKMIANKKNIGNYIISFKFFAGTEAKKSGNIKYDKMVVYYYHDEKGQNQTFIVNKVKSYLNEYAGSNKEDAYKDYLNEDISPFYDKIDKGIGVGLEIGNKSTSFTLERTKDIKKFINQYTPKPNLENEEEKKNDFIKEALEFVKKRKKEQEKSEFDRTNPYGGFSKGEARVKAMGLDELDDNFSSSL